MTDNIKLSEEELQQIRTFQETFNFLTKKYGETLFQKRLLESDQKILEEELDKMEENRKTMFAELSKKYGQGSVDMTTGEFISQKPISA